MKDLQKFEIRIRGILPAITFSGRSASPLRSRLTTDVGLTLFVMLGLTISRRAIQVPTKRFATRSISRPIVSFRPRTGSLTPEAPSLHLQLTFKTLFSRGFHHEAVSSTTADTQETPVEQQEVDKGKRHPSRYVRYKSCASAKVVHCQGPHTQG